jgi:hypothetical protein
LTDSISATQRALRSADVSPSEVTAVLLVGGSSRTPLVAEMVSSALGRPVSVDAHPKHGVALGAAIMAATAGRASTTAAPPPTPTPAPSAGLAGPAAAAAGGAALGAAAVGAARAAEIPEPQPLATSRIDRVSEAAGTRQAYVPAPASGRDDGEPPAPLGPPPDGKSRRGPLLVGAGLVALAVVGVAAVLALGGDDPEEDAGGDTTAPAGETTTTAPTTTTTTVPPGPSVNIQNVALDRDHKYQITYAVTGYTPDIEDPDALHIHFFLNTTDPEDAGTNGDPPGVWELTDVLNTYTTDYGPETKGAATQMCSAVATHDHAVYEQGTLTGNCVDLPA